LKNAHKSDGVTLRVTIGISGIFSLAIKENKDDGFSWTLPEMTDFTNSKISFYFQKELNKHGYGFQHAIRPQILEASESGRTPWKWRYDVSELPWLWLHFRALV